MRREGMTAGRLPSHGLSHLRLAELMRGRRALAVGDLHLHTVSAVNGRRVSPFGGPGIEELTVDVGPTFEKIETG